MSTTSALLALVMMVGAVPTEAEVRALARDALEPLCRGRCDVVDVELKTRAVRRGRVEPGFGDAELAVELRQVRMTILFDQRLQPSFRRFAIDRVKARVGELDGEPTVRVTPRVRPFPEPAEPLEGPSPPPVPPPQTVVIEHRNAPEPAPPEPSPEADPPTRPQPPSWGERLLSRLLDFLPALLLFVLAAWLVLRVMRRMEDLVFDLRQPPAPPAPASADEPGEGDGHGGAEPLPPPTVQGVAEGLERHRPSTRRVFRKLLLAGEHAIVARAVALFGDRVVRDLAHDPSVKPALVETGTRAAAALEEPMTDADRDALLRRLEAELIADRVAFGGEDLRPELEPLLGFGPEAFARFVGGLDDPDLARAALRHGPTHLVDAYLRGLDESDQRAVVGDLVEAAPATPETLARLGAAIEDRTEASEVGGWEADHWVDLVDGLPGPMQDELLERLARVRPDFMRRNAGRLPVESALLHVPEAALASAWSAVPLDVWLRYLRTAPAAIRSRLLTACPPRLLPGVEDELSLRVGVDPEAARSARRQVIGAALAAQTGGRTTR